MKKPMLLISTFLFGIAILVGSPVQAEQKNPTSSLSGATILATGISAPITRE